MDKLNIFICENFFPEFNRMIENEAFDDVVLVPYSSMCDNKSKKIETKKLLQQSIDNGDDGLVICSKSCDVIKLIKEGSPFDIISTNYCFNHLANEKFIDYVLGKGGYIIGLGWLRSWRERLEVAGFDRETAIRFYQDFCKELVFFDAGVDPNSEEILQDLSEYLGIPYIIIPCELASLDFMIKSKVFEWRLHKVSENHKEPLSLAQAQCAEYSALFDLIGKIAVHSTKRDTIEKVRAIFLHIFGGKHFKYWDSDIEYESIPKEIGDLLNDENKEFILLEDENRFCIKISWDERPYGVLDVGQFQFPKYIDKYLNFAIEIGKICGLILSNNQQYERILKSEKELHYLSYHDALTGLYNRSYINSILKEQGKDRKFSVFMLDIDKLKHINDNHGHLEGDKIIINTAEILKKCFREEDILARIGGDEFLAIISEGNKENIELIYKRISHEIHLYNFNVTEEHLKISISIGSAIQENQDECVESIMKKADQNMYRDKNSKTR